MAALEAGGPADSARRTPAAAASPAHNRFRFCRAAVIVLAKDSPIRSALSNTEELRRELAGAHEQGVNRGRPMNFAVRFALIAQIALIAGGVSAVSGLASVGTVLRFGD